jgi:cytochrome b pre-mRNA-processing protein 3
MILKRFRLNPRNRKIDDLYGAIVAQSRHAAFYIGYGVPDTIDGRFDLIVLHMVLLLARLDRGGPSARDLGQSLFDRFCRDLDANLREMGVGDLAVPNECGGLPKRFMEDRPPILPPLMRRTGESLRRRWRVISLGV